MLGLRNYNYAHFTGGLLRELVRLPFSGPQPGEYAPDFRVTTLDGDRVRLSDYQGRKNVLLVFGSVTCPMTAASIGGINELYDEFRGEDVEFFFVYVREAHPGERIGAHESAGEKEAAATLLREEEDIKMPIVVDDLRGSIHRKYSSLPNPAFLIDKSGRVAFRSMWSRPEALAEALEELLALEDERKTDQAVINGGSDVVMPFPYAMLRSHRALERGGIESLHDFHAALGGAGAGRSRATGPEAEPSLLENPGRVLSIAALVTAVLAGGLYAGFELRKRRLGMRGNPYRAYEKEDVRDNETDTDYGAVGI
jgi:alkyl hydroperoxide reductase subunit AhpC